MRRIAAITAILAPNRNGTGGFILPHRIPAMRLAGSEMTPRSELYIPSRYSSWRDALPQILLHSFSQITVLDHFQRLGF